MASQGQIQAAIKMAVECNNRLARVGELEAALAKADMEYAELLKEYVTYKERAEAWLVPGVYKGLEPGWVIRAVTAQQVVLAEEPDGPFGVQPPLESEPELGGEG